MSKTTFGPPFWNLSIKGKEIPESMKKCIKSLDLMSLCDGSDSCTILVEDSGFLFSNYSMFVEETPVELVFGWTGITQTVKFSGYVSAIDPIFPSEGPPLISIFCLDKTHLMNREKKRRTWENMSRAEVVASIAREYGFDCVIEPGNKFEVLETIIQADVTDIDFCEKLAEEEPIPFMCKLVRDTLYFVKKGLIKNPRSVLYYRRFPFDILSFKACITKELIPNLVKDSDIDSESFEVLEAAAGRETVRDLQGVPVDTRDLYKSLNFNESGGSVYDPETGLWEGDENDS